MAENVSDTQVPKVNGAHLVLARSLLRQRHDGRYAHGQVEATDEEGLGFLDNVPVFLQVVELVAVCGSQVGAHATVVASDDHAAASGRLLLIVAVADLETSLLVGLHEGLSILVFAHTAEVDDRLGRK